MPEQPLKSGVTVIVAVSMLLLILVAINDVMSPVPEPTSPINVLLFVQLKFVPAISPVKST